MEREIRTLAVYQDDNHNDLMVRLKFVLIELGIKVTVVEAHPECTVYSLSHAERLHGKEEGS
jgi:hypothetical protein